MTEPRAAVSVSDRHSTPRQRPLNPRAMADTDLRMPLREEKMQRRESRMGLRNLFTRSSRNLREQKDSDKERENDRFKEVREHHQQYQQYQQQHQHNHQDHHHHCHNHHQHHQPQPQQQQQQQQPKTECPGPSPFNPPHSHNLKNTPSKSGLRASILDYWPLATPQSRLEAPLPDFPPTADDSRPQPNVIRRQKSSTLLARPSRTASGVPWQPPPLFQAYPQAVKYIHLRAATISGDSLLRLNEKNEKKGASSLRSDLTQSSSAGAPSSDEPVAMAAANDREKEKERPRLRNHRRRQSGSVAKFEWTTKIYVLVTSGYLLQYAGAGPFDRPPEKILSLSKDSAAFASDLIPGKHWVLHVTAQTDAEGNPADPAAAAAAAPSRSLFSRLQFRTADRRNASNFFMIFEDSEDMEAWILVLRKEIEALGGKKNVSETATGGPVPEHGHHSHSLSADRGLRTKTSRRTLIVRDPNRFPSIKAPPPPSLDTSSSWSSPPTSQPDIDGNSGGRARRGYEHAERGLDPGRPSHETATTTTATALADAMSTTNSFVSHDGRQLDNLRESSLRLSLISSGQRTFLTSPGSSPACSPLREAFPSHLQEEPRTPSRDLQPVPLLPHPPLFLRDDIRMRPDAFEGPERRQSLRTGNPLLGDMAMFHSGMTYTPPQPMPNFSVPHTMSRRASLVRPVGPAMEHQESTSPLAAENIARSGRRPPLPLPLNPRNSIIPDCAPPKHAPLAFSRQSSFRQSGNVTAVAGTQCALRRCSSVESANMLSRQMTLPARPPSANNPSPGASYSFEARNIAPRKHASMHTLRSQSVSSAPLLPAFDFSSHMPTRSSLPLVPPITASPSGSPARAPAHFLQVPHASPQPPAPASPPSREVVRCASSLGIRDEARPRSPSFSSPGRSPPGAARCRKRASLQVMSSGGLAVHRSMTADADFLGITIPSNHMASLMVSNARAASVSMHAGLDLSCHTTQGAGNRRSLPQLAEGPPPAPPPTCALPPIPQKSALKA